MRAPKTLRLDPLQPGSIFAGKYEILGAIDTGGETAAYKVRDQNSGEVRLLRLRRPEEDGPAKIREGSPSHENVERVYEVAEQDGLLFAVAEYFEGRPIADLLAGRTTPLPRAEVIPLIRHICAGIAAIHAAGAVHGNLSTRTIVVSSSGVLKLQAAGFGARATAAGDVRAAGIVFMEMLTGRDPGARTSLPELPADLASLVGACLDPNGGFRDGGELLEAARRVQTAGAAAQVRTLADLMTEEPRNPQEVVPLFLRIVDQLVALQSQGARPDFSPRKVYLRPGGAVEVETARGDSLQHTMVAEPKYCPPEMFRTSAEGADQPASAYIYVLGFVFYEILAGQRLFREQFAEFGAEPDAFQWMRWQADQQKALRPLAGLLPGFSGPLSDLIGNMTEKDAGRRLARLEDVRDGLGSVQTRAVDTAQIRLAPVEPQAPPRRRRPVLKLAVWAAVVTCALGLAAWLLLPVQPEAIQTTTGPMVLGNAGGAPFYIDRYEITNWQYKKFCDETGRPYRAGPGWDPAYFEKPEYPVRNISDADFQAYAAWAGKRVPNRAEVSGSAARFAAGRYAWQPRDAGAETVGFRCVADPVQALKLRAGSRFRQLWNGLANR